MDEAARINVHLVALGQDPIDAQRPGMWWHAPPLSVVRHWTTTHRERLATAQRTFLATVR